MKKYKSRLLKVVLVAMAILFLQGISAQSKPTQPKIKNTNQFISYIRGLQNIADYVKQKDTIEKLGLKIKFSESISQSNKDQLKEYYDKVKATSDELYDKITADLLDRSTRSTIIKDPKTYVDSLNKRFQKIKDAETDFFSDYTQVIGQPQSKSPVVLAWIIKNFILPLAEAFITEKILPDIIKAQLNKRLKPVIVIKSWDQLSKK